LAKRKTKTKMTRKEMKKDPLVTFSLKAADFVRMHARVIIIASVAIVVSIVVIAMMVRDRSSAETAAEMILVQANKELWSGNPAQATVYYDELLDRYSGTSCGKKALLFKGDALLETQSYDEAITTYERFLQREKKDDLLRVSARRGIAAALEEKGEFARAAKIREDLSRLVQGNEAAEEMMAAARCYRAAAMYGMAIELYEKVVSNHPDYWGKSSAMVSLEELRTQLKLTSPGSSPDSN